MTTKITISFLAKKLKISPATVNRLVLKDGCFPRPTKIGREKYFSSNEVQAWLQSRVIGEGEIQTDDKIMSGARLLQLTGRSKGWMWLNIVKPQALTRINLSPDPESNKLINFFIEREVYGAFGDLIEVANGGEA